MNWVKKKLNVGQYKLMMNSFAFYNKCQLSRFVFFVCFFFYCFLELGKDAATSDTDSSIEHFVLL